MFNEILIISWNSIPSIGAMISWKYQSLQTVLSTRSFWIWWPFFMLKELTTFVNRWRSKRKSYNFFNNNHLTICRSLKISKTSFYRIKKELKVLKNLDYKSKRKSKDHNSLSVIEQEYISKLVKSPTSQKYIHK